MLQFMQGFIHIGDTRPLQPPTMTKDRTQIPMHGFPMIAWVVVGETYDRRDDGQLLLNLLYIFRVIGRVVVCKTYDGRDYV
mgnify:CR=1 FL=1